MGADKECPQASSCQTSSNTYSLGNGVVNVYKRSAGAWNFKAKISNPDTNYFGARVAISTEGESITVAAADRLHLHAFIKQGSGFVLQQTWTGLQARSISLAGRIHTEGYRLIAIFSIQAT